MKSPIKFGTSGWRGIIAQDFTFNNVRLATEGIVRFLNKLLAKRPPELEGKSKELLISYDPRFLGREFALTAATVVERGSLKALITPRDTPTPVLSVTIRSRKTLGCINITASHNPPEYQGLKYSNWLGAAAPPEITSQIESEIQNITEAEFEQLINETSRLCEPEVFDPSADYFSQVNKLVDFKILRKNPLKVIVDFMHGTGRGYLDVLLKKAKASVRVLNDRPDPLFGGRRPEPDEEGLADVSRLVRRMNMDAGFGLDGDADRFGIVDSNGRWLSPNEVLALVLYHLKHNRGWTGGVVRTVPTSHFVDAVAGWLNVPVFETPVGFKYVGAVMESKEIIVGGEESGGLSVKGHIPEKDGIVACLLMAELRSFERKSFTQILKDLEKKIKCKFITRRINIEVDPSHKEKILKKLSSGVEKIGDFIVDKIVTTDGYKFIFTSGEWMAFRASGTEPLFRCYLEARSHQNLKKFQELAAQLVKVD